MYTARVMSSLKSPKVRRSLGLVLLSQLINVPPAAFRRIDDSIQAVQESNQPTLDAIVEEKRRREAQQAAEAQEQQLAMTATSANEEAEGESGEEGMGGLAGEADSQGAFNPETGEINWDCPCLGGMAHGPCGEEFKAAFSCFVYSTEEPKGIECIDKFKYVHSVKILSTKLMNRRGMQDCFRLHPEMYGSELEVDEDEIEEELLARENAASGESETTSKLINEATSTPAQKAVDPIESQSPETTKSTPEERTSKPIPDTKAHAISQTQDSDDKDDELIPKAAHDATKK